MHTGDNNQHEQPRSSDEITGNLGHSDAFYNPLERNHDQVPNYFDVVKVLSEVELLPSPSPVQATSCTLTRNHNPNRFHEGQSSGTKSKPDDNIEENIERKREPKRKQRESQQASSPGSRRKSTKTNIIEKRRRHKISERIRTLKTLVPNCNKELTLQHLQRDKASILGDAIQYIKYLQMQTQTMQSMGIGYMSPGLYMTMARQPSLQVSNIAPNFTMNPFIGMQHGMQQIESYAPVNYPIFPTSFPGYGPLVPQMEVGTQSLPVTAPRPDLWFPSQTSQHLYSTSPSSGTIIPTTDSQGGSTVPNQPFHVPMTSQGTK